MSYLQVTLDVDRSVAERVCELMEELGALSITIESGSGEEYFDESSPSEPLWQKQSLAVLFEGENDVDAQVASLSQQMAEMDALRPEAVLNPMPDLVFKQIPDQDWERVWLDQFKPIQVGHRLWVCPSWCEPVAPSHHNLLIDPGLAFGTGTHPTTQLCLEHLSYQSLQSRSVLDFGCGTGILGIAAAKLGAKPVFGTDVDDKAITASNDNARMNTVSDDFSGMLNDDFFASHGEKQFDLVIANILAGTLINLADQLKSTAAPNGQILLSGILYHQVEAVIDAYRDTFDFETKQKGDWMLLIGEKRGG